MSKMIELKEKAERAGAKMVISEENVETGEVKVIAFFPNTSGNPIMGVGCWKNIKDDQDVKNPYCDVSFRCDDWWNKGLSFEKYVLALMNDIKEKYTDEWSEENQNND